MRIALLIGIRRPRAFRVSGSDVGAATPGPLVLRLRFPGVCERFRPLLRRLHIVPSLHAHEDENQQNNYGDDAEDSADSGPSFAPEDRLERA
jgi:hypothetical protein